jgi:hypothetical protein
MNNISDLQIGKAGEYLVCADLILQGHIAFPSEQGLPYDVVFDYKDRLYKVQVKTTRTSRNIPQRKNPVKGYIFNIKRRGKGNHSRTTNDSCDMFALVALDTKIIGYLPNTDVKETMNFRAEKFRGTYRVEDSGTYIESLTLEMCLDNLKKEIW